jgi:lysyl-tRNA synthetase class 2
MAAVEELLPLDEPGLSKNELKRRKKMHAKAAAKAAKGGQAAAAASGAGDAPKVDESALSGGEYKAFRMKMLDSWEAAGVNPYPHKFSVSIGLPAFLEKFGGLADAEEATEEVSIAGRVMLIRNSSKKLNFYDIHADGAKLQAMCNFRNFGDAKGVSQPRAHRFSPAQIMKLECLPRSCGI